MPDRSSPRGRPSFLHTIALVFSITGVFCGCSTGSQVPVDSLVASERAFAALSVAQGSQAAFLAFLDDSSVIFRPHPVNGKEWLARQAPRPSTLAWEPAFAECSAGGDMGFTTGPWRFFTSAKGEEPVAFGYFVSVWGRRPDGPWKVLLDVGTSNPRPSSDSTVLHLGPLSQATGRGNLPHGGDFFMNAELRLGQTVGESLQADAYRAVAADDCRFYREGHLPAVGPDQARAILGEVARAARFTPLAMRESASSDMAYVYGRYEIGRGEVPEETGYYLRIWSIAPSGAPAMLLDLMSPLPPR